MNSEFTEFSFGFAATHELILENSGNVFAAPEFPSLILSCLSWNCAVSRRHETYCATQTT